MKAHRIKDDGCYQFADVEDGKYKVRVKRCKGGGQETVEITVGVKVNDVDFECKK